MTRNPFRILTGAAMFAAPLSLGLIVAPIASMAAQTVPAKDTTAAKAALPIDGIAAVVGDQVVLISEVSAEALRRRGAGYPVKTRDDYVKLEEEVLQQLVEAELLVQKAKAEKIEVNDAELQRTVSDNEKEVRKQYATDAELREALKANGLGSIDEWRTLQTNLYRRDNLQRDLIQKYKRDGKMTAVNVSEAEVSEAFEANKDRLPKKEARVGLRQIVLATEPSEAAKKRAKAKIDSIRLELEKHPDDFAQIAKKVSMDASAELGGDLGWNRRGVMVPEFDRMMFALNPGTISPVVETTYGYHIIKVDRVQPAEVKARHILIRWTLDSADQADAKARADSIAAAWRAGANFDSLSIRYHDISGGEEKTIPEFPRDSLPEVYRNAIEGHHVKDVLDPFPIPSSQPGINKYVIAQITFLDDAGAYTLPEMRNRIRSQLSEERSMRRFIDSLKKQTYISIRYDPDKVLPKTPM